MKMTEAKEIWKKWRTDQKRGKLLFSLLICSFLFAGCGDNSRFVNGTSLKLPADYRE
jgi:hypothetical protein